MTVPPEALTVEQAARIAERIPCGCDWSPEIPGCPHREWCDRMTPLGTIREIAALAAPLIAAAERDRIRQLAERYGAIYPAQRKTGPAATTELVVATPFADLLRDAP